MAACLLIFLSALLRCSIGFIDLVSNAVKANGLCSSDLIFNLRLGRTARATNTGTAYTFFTVANIKQSKDLINVLKEANQVGYRFRCTSGDI